MRDLWHRLESWATTNSGRSLGWRAGATERAIAAAEQKLRLRFPADYRMTLQLHDGQAADAAFEWLPGCAPLRSLDEVVECWDAELDLVETAFEDELQIEGPLYTARWHPRRIPIAGTTYVDLVPSRAGTAGQIIAFVSDCRRALLGDGLRDALERFVLALERGDWVWSADRSRVVPRDEQPGARRPTWQRNESYEFSRYVAAQRTPRPPRKTRRAS